jgi:hypothetical protein
VIVKVNACDVPPPGGGLTTTTWAVPTATKYLAGMPATSSSAVRLGGMDSGDPFHNTVEVGRKPVPLIVMDAFPRLAMRSVGEMEVTTGTGLSCEKTLAGRVRKNTTTKITLWMLEKIIFTIL